jgi:hypothetical protein
MFGKNGVKSQSEARRWPMFGAMVILIIAALAVACAPTGGSTAHPAAGGPRLTAEDQVQRIAPAEAKALLDQGKAVLYDVRSEDIFMERHAVGAQSLPLAEIEARLASLPKDKMLILYCT